jgi:hypothetical protein
VVSGESLFTENKDIIDLAGFFALPPGLEKFRYCLFSKRIPELQKIWSDFWQSMNTQRALYQDFNMMFMS